jgi:hypothetical protein
VRWPIATMALMSAVAVGGCGSSAGPAAVVRQAVESRSPSRCDLYTDAFFARAGTSAHAGRQYCRQVAAALPAVHVRVSGVDIHGSTAVVTVVAAGRTAVYRMISQHGSWLIDQLVR